MRMILQCTERRGRRRARRRGWESARIVWLVALWATATVSVGSDESAGQADRVAVSPLPTGLSSLMPIPERNPLTAEKIRLGEKLFFDARLSGDGTISCASCHDPSRAFTDGRARPVGIGGARGRRNAPTLLNSAYRRVLFWDGRFRSLEDQALAPILNPDEMGASLERVQVIIGGDPGYRAAFMAAFGAGEVSAIRLAQALASFQRSLVAADTDFDRFDRSGDETLLSAAARRGLELFRGKARCGHCHEGRLFTDDRFHNTGVSWGNEPADWGQFELTGVDEDRGKFRTPTLRHLTATAPYMHDGSLATLEEVIEFYDRGGSANPRLDPVLRPLQLSPREKADLAAFLRSLSTRTADPPSREPGDEEAELYATPAFPRRVGGPGRQFEVR